MVAASAAGAAEPPPHCVHPEVILWGDGRHDDTQALNAWLQGADAVWAATGETVGATIANHGFRLSAAIYVTGGTQRVLQNFRFSWPERGETVTGDAIKTGDNPDLAPVSEGISIVGGDAGEGVPFEAPDPAAANPDTRAGCAIS